MTLLKYCSKQASFRLFQGYFTLYHTFSITMCPSSSFSRCSGIIIATPQKCVQLKQNVKESIQKIYVTQFDQLKQYEKESIQISHTKEQNDLHQLPTESDNTITFRTKKLSHLQKVIYVLHTKDIHIRLPVVYLYYFATVVSSSTCDNYHTN